MSYGQAQAEHTVPTSKVRRRMLIDPDTPDCFGRLNVAGPASGKLDVEQLFTREGQPREDVAVRAYIDQSCRLQSWVYR